MNLPESESSSRTPCAFPIALMLSCKAVIPEAVDFGYLLLRGQPRSLIGSQNELVFLASHEMRESEISMESLTKYLNGVPLFAIDDLPDLAFQKAVIQDPPFEVSYEEGLPPGCLN